MAGAPPAAGGAMPPPASRPNACSRCMSSLAGCIRSAAIEKVMRVMRVMNIINGGLLIFSGVWGYMNFDNAMDVIYLATYVALFGILIIGFEFRWNRMENKMRRLFGFMYSPYGRAMFFVFSATLCWGIDLWLPILVGIFTLINAVFQCFVICSHPGFKEYSKVKKTDDPANLPEDEVIAYLRTHPDVAQQAVGPAFPSSSGSASSSASRPSAPARSSARPKPSPRKPAPAPRASAPAAPARSSNEPPSDNPFDL